MAFGDFLKYFEDLDICHISHDIDQDITFHGRWEDGLNAGGVQKADWKNFAKNPQCFIRLSDPDPIDPQGRSAAVVSLMQRRQPNSRAKGMNKVSTGCGSGDCTPSPKKILPPKMTQSDMKIHFWG